MTNFVSLLFFDKILQDLRPRFFEKSKDQSNTYSHLQYVMMYYYKSSKIFFKYSFVIRLDFFVIYLCI